ncbi:MAG: hypothetical protein RMY28_016415 [Nostoc sp. ChiSLP01]|nr:hypothetical protein [Nostoc sp. CmiSLP01]MDZ8283153.1 hypothetical protein [Nostoc sp. ChiSLP01]
MYQTDPPRSPKDVLPTKYDLPSEDPQAQSLSGDFAPSELCNRAV